MRASISIPYHWVHVAPATILDDHVFVEDDESPLSFRDEASHNALCYLRILRRLEGTVYLGQVSAHPDFVSAQTFTVLFTEEQLRYALPWDRRLVEDEKTAASKADAARILPRLHAHAAALQPATQKVRSQEAMSAISVEVTSKEVQSQIAQAISQDNERAAPASSQERGFSLQQAFLCAMIDALMKYLYQGLEIVQAVVLHAQCALVAQVQQWHRQNNQRLVTIVPRFSQQRQRTVWQLSMAVPDGFSLAA